MSPRRRDDLKVREQIVAAAVEVLRTRGHAAASARTIATEGGFSPGLVYYYFEDLSDLLLAALDATSGRRLARYRPAMEAAGSVAELAREARRLFREDVRSGDLTVLSELMAASRSRPGFGPLVTERLEPWITLTEETIGRLTQRSLVRSLLPPRQVARALVALYAGIELFYALDGDEKRSDELFALLERLSSRASVLLAPVRPARGGRT